MDSPSLFLIVPGFGTPNVSHKLDILRSNIAKIRAFPWSKFHAVVCVYDDTEIPDDLVMDEHITWQRCRGIVGQFIKTYAPLSIATNYDFVMVILDDIELQPDFNIPQLLRLHNTFRMDIYSPSLTLDSKFQFQYMLTQPNGNYTAKVTSACEAFCYFMPYKSYAAWYAQVDGTLNPWLWGLDMCLWKCIGLRPMVLNCMTMRHYYKNESYAQRPDADPQKGYNSVLEKFSVTTQELADQQAVRYYITEPLAI